MVLWCWLCLLLSTAPSFSPPIFMVFVEVAAVMLSNAVVSQTFISTIPLSPSISQVVVYRTCTTKPSVLLGCHGSSFHLRVTPSLRLARQQTAIPSLSHRHFVPLPSLGKRLTFKPFLSAAPALLAKNASVKHVPMNVMPVTMWSTLEWDRATAIVKQHPSAVVARIAAASSSHPPCRKPLNWGMFDSLNEKHLVAIQWMKSLSISMTFFECHY